MKFRYYYGSQAEQFSFVRIPRIILVEKEFQTLSIAAKMLYGVLLDRMNLSMKNRWLDEENRVYIIYPIDEIRETLGFSKKKAVDLLAELEEFGLLEKKRRGLGLPNILYVMSFLSSENEGSDEQPESGSGDHEIPRSTDSDTSKSTETDTSRSIENTTLEVSGQEPLKNKIDNSNTYTSYHSDRIVSGLNENDPMTKEKTEETDFMRFDGIGNRIKDEDRREGSILVFPNETEHYRQLIRKNIAYDDLLTVHAEERELINGIEGLIFETVLHKQEHIVIASNRYPAELVKSRFLKLNYRHIEYVLHCLQQNTTKVKNIRKYLLAALFNAPSTMDAYFQAEVNHDMQQYALARK